MTPKRPDVPPGKMVRVERGIYVRVDKRGRARYYVRVTTGYNDTLRVAGDTITAARVYLDAVNTAARAGRFEVTTHERAPTFADFADTYLDYAKQNKRSWKRDEGILRHARAFLEGKRIDGIVTWDIERYKSKRRESVKPATVNRELAVLSRLFVLAGEWGHEIDNPVAPVRFFKEPEHPMRVLSDDEERALIREAAVHLKPLIVVALNTGLRRGELLALEWGAVNVVTHTVTVKHSKSGRVRHVPINDMAREYLRSVPGSQDRGAVFRYNGHTLTVTTLRRGFLEAVAAAKLPALRFHDLRHTFATRMVLAGVDIVTVKELLGHASITTTMRYAHPSPEHKRAAVNRLLLAHYGFKPKTNPTCVKTVEPDERRD